jgi:hypothetical protein
MKAADSLGKTRSLDIIGIEEDRLVGFVVDDGRLVRVDGCVVGFAISNDRSIRQRVQQLKQGVLSVNELRAIGSGWPVLKAETQKPSSAMTFLIYRYGHHALEFIYQTAASVIDLDSRADIDMAFRMLFTAELYLPSPVDDHLHRDENTLVVQDLVVQDFEGISSDVRYPRSGWVNPKAFDTEALKDVNDAMHLLIQEMKPLPKSDLNLCFEQLFKMFQHLEVNE